MKHSKFKYSNIEIKNTDSENDEVFHICFVQNSCLSLWRTSFWNRLKFLFHGKIWLTIKGDSQPSVALSCKKEIFEKTFQPTRPNTTSSVQSFQPTRDETTTPPSPKKST